MIPPAGARGKTGSDLRQCLSGTCGQAGGREKKKGTAASPAEPETSDGPRVPLELYAWSFNSRRAHCRLANASPTRSAPRAGRLRGQCESATSEAPQFWPGTARMSSANAEGPKPGTAGRPIKSHGETLPDLMAELHQTSQCSGRTGGTCRRFVMSSWMAQPRRKGWRPCPPWPRIAGNARGSQRELLSLIGNGRFAAAVEPAWMRTAPLDGPGTGRRRR